MKVSKRLVSIVATISVGMITLPFFMGLGCPPQEKEETKDPYDQVVDCTKMSETDCKESKDCTFGEDNKCGAAADDVKGSCAAIQGEDACKADDTCEWKDDACGKKAE